MTDYVYTAPFNMPVSLDTLLAPYLAGIERPDRPPPSEQLPAPEEEPEPPVPAPTLEAHAALDQRVQDLEAEVNSLNDRMRVVEARMQAVTTAMNMGGPA